MFNWALSCEVTQRPKYTWLGSDIVTEPTEVQLTPSGEVYPRNRLPTRVSRTQYGATTCGPAVRLLPPPAEMRRWKEVPLPGVITIIACREFAVSDCRIMTPALAESFVFCTPLTRARISPSPVMVCQAKWNWSEEPQMSLPAPFTVKTPPAAEALPASPGLPMSWLAQGEGRCRP